MIQRFTTAAVLLALFSGLAPAQENPFPRFKQFKDLIPGIDLYASDRSDIEAFVKPIVDARGKMAIFLGDDIARGAIFICSTLEQKDAVYEQRVLKYGYKWYLLQMTAEAQRQERLARMQAMAATSSGQSGQGSRGGQSAQGSRGDQGGQSSRQGSGQDRAGAQPPSQAGRQGGGPQSPDFRAALEARAAATMATQVGYAILMSSLANDKPYRLSRLDDMSRSPLNDWLDIAIVSYATGSIQNSYRILQDRLDDCFPLDDVLSMSRPFVAQQDSSSGGSGGGGEMSGMRMGGAADTGGGRAQSGSQGSRGDQSGSGTRVQSGGGRGGSGRVLPKDVVDRMVFDAQASSFFAFLIQKAGIEKVKDMVQQNRNKVETLQVVMNLLGSDTDKLEQDWLAWVKEQKSPNP